MISEVGIMSLSSDIYLFSGLLRLVSKIRTMDSLSSSLPVYNGMDISKDFLGEGLNSLEDGSSLSGEGSSSVSVLNIYYYEG